MRIKIKLAKLVILGSLLLIYTNCDLLQNRAKNDAEEEQIRSRLESLSNVEIIEIKRSGRDFTAPVSAVSFRLKDRPGSFIELYSPGYSLLKQKSTYFDLSRIGRWQLSSCGYDYVGHYEMATGKQVKSVYGSSGIDIGTEGPFADNLPFKVETIEDIISHYSELENIFEHFPDRGCRGEPIPRAGNEVSFHLPEKGMPN
jgi:hypothetical protein